MVALSLRPRFTATLGDPIKSGKQVLNGDPIKDVLLLDPMLGLLQLLVSERGIDPILDLLFLLLFDRIYVLLGLNFIIVLQPRVAMIHHLDTTLILAVVKF